jgi:hypothetical protein
VRQRVGWALALLCWGLALGLALVWVRPGMESGPVYNSDNGIPLLMARAARVGPYYLYYLGQDRFGAWPFMVARFVGGRNWSAEGLQALLLVAVWTAAFPLARLVRGSGVSTAVLVGVPLAMMGPVVVRDYVLDATQPYGWQFLMLAWTWLGTRRLLESDTWRARVGWLVAASLTAALAIWTSTTSLPMLGMLWAVESARAWARGRMDWRGVLLAAVPPSVGGVFEKQVRLYYHAQSLRVFGDTAYTRTMLDEGRLWDNAQRVFSLLWTGPVPQGALLFTWLGVTLAWIAWRSWRGRAAWANLSEPAWVALGCGLAALMQLAALVAVVHVRLNGFAPRYFALPHLLLLVGVGALVLHQVVARLPSRLAPLTGALVAAAGCVALGWAWDHPPAPREGMDQARDAAQALARMAPDTLLVGGYWNVFRLAALQPLEGQARPVPQPRDYQRSPFYWADLEAARTLVWVRSADDEEPPEPVAREVRGVVFIRYNAPLAQLPGFTFWRYVRATRVEEPSP